MTLLILSSEKDLTADFLIVELISRGLPYFRLNSEDLAKAQYAYRASSGGVTCEIALGPKSINISDVNAVWYRRAITPMPMANMPPGQRQFVAGELRHLAAGLAMNTDALWVNPIDRVSAAEHKLYQLSLAHDLGFRVPRTLVTRDWCELRQFASENLGGTICKPIYHGLFIEGASRYSIYTRRVDPNTLDADSVDPCPVLLQEEIRRVADVRVTIIGTKCYVADITGANGLIDWRDPAEAVEYSVSRLSDEMLGRCRAMMERLGLIYGAFDFIRTPDGGLVFLEVNPTGEWAWLENKLGFPIRDAFIQTFFGEPR